MADLLQVKLSTGEWIIGEVQETIEKNDYLLLKQPLMIHIVPQGPDKYGAALIPFDPTNPSGTVKVFLSSIVASPVTIAKGLYDSYIQNTTGLEIISSLDGVEVKE